MWETADWVFRIVIVASVIGLFVWAIKGWWEEKTKRHSAKDQTPTWEEIAKWFDKEKAVLVTSKDLSSIVDRLNEKCRDCIRECNAKRNIERDKELSHFADLFHQQLEHGEKRFEAMERSQAKTTEALTSISQNLALLTQTVDRAIKTGRIEILDAPR